MSSEYGKIYTQGLFQTVAIYCHKFPAQLSLMKWFFSVCKYYYCLFISVFILA